MREVSPNKVEISKNGTESVQHASPNRYRFEINDKVGVQSLKYISIDLRWVAF